MHHILRKSSTIIYYCNTVLVDGVISLVEEAGRAAGSEVEEGGGNEQGKSTLYILHYMPVHPVCMSSGSFRSQ